MLIEKVQNMYTKLLRHGNIMTPEQRNQMIGITKHKTRRLRGDLIYIFKLFNDRRFFTPHSETHTRAFEETATGTRPQQYQATLICAEEHCSVEQPAGNCNRNARNNIRQHSFALRNIAAWNNLPETIIAAESLISFKNKLDIFFSSQ